MTQRNTERDYLPLTEREQWLAKEIVDIAFNIHKTLGPGLLESVYQKCFCYDLAKRNIFYTNQQMVSLKYDDLILDNSLKIDLMVENLIIIELKAQENYHTVWEAQLLSYLKLTGKRLGYIINFHVPLIRDGIKRRIL